MIDVLMKSLLTINCLGCHQSSISPLPVHATAGPVFIKQNKYQILINIKCWIKGTNIYKVYQVYTFSIHNFCILNRCNVCGQEISHEILENHISSSSDIAMNIIPITRWKRVQ